MITQCLNDKTYMSIEFFDRKNLSTKRTQSVISWHVLLYLLFFGVSQKGFQSTLKIRVSEVTQ